jgi:hypothetical protein
MTRPAVAAVDALIAVISHCHLIFLYPLPLSTLKTGLGEEKRK